MPKTTRQEWSNSPLIATLRWEDDDNKLSGPNPSTSGQKGRKQPVSKRVGLWIDRKQAVIVSIRDNVEARSIITSDMEHYVLYSTVVPGDGSPEEARDQRFWNHLAEYYDKIAAHLHDALEILIFGPDEAKYELQKRLDDAGLGDHIVSVEDAGPLTIVRIAEKVRERFPVRSQFDIF